MTLQPKQKVYWEIIPSSGPSTMQRLQYTMDDTALRCRSIPKVEMEPNHVWSPVEAWTDTLRMCRQGANSPCTQKTSRPRTQVRTEQSVADVTSATRSRAKAPPERSAEPNSLPVRLLPPHLTGKVKSSVPYQGIQYPSPNRAGETLDLSRRHRQSGKKSQ